MFSRIKVFLKGFGKPETIPTVTETTTERKAVKSGFSMDHPWPFVGEAPTQAHIVELLQGVQTEGEHAFYTVDGEHPRRVRNSYHDPRRIVWWLEGRKMVEGASGLTTSCGIKDCIKLSHLVLNWPDRKIGPEPKPQKNVTQVKKTGKIESHSNVFEKGDRTKCVSAKVYFAKENQAKLMARHLNSPEVRKGRGRRLYTYDCPWCDGFHLTKTNPAKHNYVAKGSW